RIGFAEALEAADAAGLDVGDEQRAVLALIDLVGAAPQPHPTTRHGQLDARRPVHPERELACYHLRRPLLSPRRVVVQHPGEVGEDTYSFALPQPGVAGQALCLQLPRLTVGDLGKSSP